MSDAILDESTSGLEYNLMCEKIKGLALTGWGACITLAGTLGLLANQKIQTSGAELTQVINTAETGQGLEYVADNAPYLADRGIVGVVAVVGVVALAYGLKTLYNVRTASRSVETPSE